MCAARLTGPQAAGAATEAGRDGNVPALDLGRCQSVASSTVAAAAARFTASMPSLAPERVLYASPDATISPFAAFSRQRNWEPLG